MVGRGLFSHKEFRNILLQEKKANHSCRLNNAGKSAHVMLDGNTSRSLDTRNDVMGHFDLPTMHY